MEITEYLTPLRRWWWLLVLGTLVASAATYFSLRQQPPIYQAHTTLMIGRAINNPNPSTMDIYLSGQLANTYVDIANLSSVRKAAMAGLGLDWLPGYTVALRPDTQLLDITVTDTDPRMAKAAADEVARQLILQSPTGGDSEVQQRQQFVKRQLDDLESNIDATKNEITRLQADLASMLSAREIADAQNQIAALQNKLATLQANYAALMSNTDQGALNTLTVVEPAELPTAPVGTSKTRTLMLVAAIGFILAAGTAYLLSYLDDTLKTPPDVKKALGLTTLGAIPRIDGGAKGANSELVMLSEKHSAPAEAYRVLRTNLQFASVDHPLGRLLVTSPAPIEGKSLTTANLALALAQSGQRVIAIDADLHRSRLHKLFGLSNNVGLTSALLEEAPDLGALLQPTALPGLRVLTAGPTPPNPTDLVGTARMRDLLARLSAEADILLLDSPPVVILADASVLSTQVDGVLLVIDAGTTRRDVARHAVETLRGVNARIVGVLMNRVPGRGSGYYHSYYKSYGYGKSGRRGASGSRRSARSRLAGWLRPRRPKPEPAARSETAEESSSVT